ncbi:hypothetical protein [Rhodovulum adriaticum]|uniref:Uncharacterized protein n=1 Tax=Rhodovulum adriaticum TaxID=35804 RepID=A0A4R2NKW5_RHOAD|nr:hypothetical protein [Rhodovulum adriaticum]MBK1635130.1 hypothetical protein [Rhodovulum adriaticum]TCP22243.1 hypothetical protein EV656_10751 [Rhodovulum adriaticum]
MDRLSIMLTPVTGAVITGFIVIALFSLGFYNWAAVGTGAVIGAILAWPAAYIVSRKIKGDDPFQTRARTQGMRGLPEV